MRVLPLIILHLSLSLLVPPGPAEDARPLSREEFVERITGQTYECSFTSYAKVRFFADRMEILDENEKIVRTVKDSRVAEPGVIIVSLIKGGSIWFIFSDDLDTFCVANMTEVHSFSSENAEAPLKRWPESGNPSGIVVKLDAHPAWQKIRVEKEKATPVLQDGTEGEPFPVIRFNNYALGALYKRPEQKSGASLLLLSKDGTTGWWLEGDHLGSGAKTFRNRDATSNRDSILKGFSRRSSQFGWYLLKMGKLNEALAQEKYTEYYLNQSFGPASEYTIDGLKVMGELRGSALRYDLAPYWLTKARDLAKVTFQADPDKIMDYEIALANGYVEAGQYQEALDTLQGMAKQPDLKAQFKRREYTYVYILSEASFGTGNYARAATWQKACADRARENNYGDWVIDGMLGEVTCHLARGDKPAALATLNETIAYQEERQKSAKPGTNFETHELALACIALEQWDKARQFSNEGNFKSAFFEFEEVVRLLTLWNSGDKTGAVSLATKIGNRFKDDFSNTIRSRDSTEVFVAIIEVLGAPDSPEKVSAFRKTLAEQKELLKKRSLKNYLLIYAATKADRLLAG